MKEKLHYDNGAFEIEIIKEGKMIFLMNFDAAAYSAFILTLDLIYKQGQDNGNYDQFVFAQLLTFERLLDEEADPRKLDLVHIYIRQLKNHRLRKKADEFMNNETSTAA